MENPRNANALSPVDVYMVSQTNAMMDVEEGGTPDWLLHSPRPHVPPNPPSSCGQVVYQQLIRTTQQGPPSHFLNTPPPPPTLQNQVQGLN